MNGYRRLLGTMLLLTMASGMAAGVQAASFFDELEGHPYRDPGDTNGFASPVLEVIDTTEMAELRGGFSINGLDLAFGARVRSMIDDVMQQTMVEFRNTGPHVISQTLTDPTGNAHNVNPSSNNVANVSPVGISLPGMSNFSGMALNDAKGFTAVLHQITNQAIIGSVVSNASDRQISNQIDVDVSVNNMEALRSLSAHTRILNSLLR
ncbi:hypothetical protein [Billgrantia gudaonensis]|uniref:Uncharacterized protein n=1 Tax=Billgrantia gudaonensis TaxID=376427 RepID=A0A1G8PFJ2_9GAMM|nr:hypothetical protein [Halomonas gudaonensis]SDI91294.1 hypothetical protein SAMN04487954_10269 [Halomonas gudaonensis]